MDVREDGGKISDLHCIAKISAKLIPVDETDVHGNESSPPSEANGTQTDQSTSVPSGVQ
jgi:hypothetical protein